MTTVYRYADRAFVVAEGQTRTRTYNGKTYTAVLVDVVTGETVNDSDVPPGELSPPLPTRGESSRGASATSEPRRVPVDPPRLAALPFPELDEGNPPDRAELGRNFLASVRRLVDESSLSPEAAAVWLWDLFETFGIAAANRKR